MVKGPALSREVESKTLLCMSSCSLWAILFSEALLPPDSPWHPSWLYFTGRLVTEDPKSS